MQRGRLEVQRALSKKGFEEQEGKSHIRYIFHTRSGTKTDVTTMVSRGSSYKTLGNDLLGKMAKQCKLNKNKFLDLVDCTLSHQEYEKLVIKDNDYSPP